MRQDKQKRQQVKQIGKKKKTSWMVCRATLQLQVQETDVQKKVSVTIEESQKHELVERVKKSNMQKLGQVVQS